MQRYLKLLVAGFLVSSISAYSDDNTVLYVCKSDAIEAGQGLFSGDVSVTKVKKTTITIGQDNNPISPLFEVKYEGFDGRGKSVAGPITVRRVALAKNESGSVSVTYSASRSTGRQRAGVFNILIPPTLAGKLTFTQINNRNAPSHPKLDLDCEATSEELRLPVAVDLEKYNDEEQVRILRHLKDKLANKSLYLEKDSEDKRPDNITPEAEANVATWLNNANIEEEVLRKNYYVGKNATITWTGTRCESTKINSLTTIRDFTGSTIAYIVSFDCKNPALLATYPPDREGKVRTSKFRLGLDKVYVTPTRVLFQDAKIDLDRVNDKEEE